MQSSDTDEGYCVRVADDGLLALPMILQQRPVMVILDLWLPNLDGRAMYQVVRERYGHQVGIVVCSATIDAPAWAAEVAAEGVLEKPFTLDDLSATVARALPASDRLMAMA
jgi:DNA-binding response OmpR family regulator